MNLGLVRLQSKTIQWRRSKTISWRCSKMIRWRRSETILWRWSGRRYSRRRHQQQRNETIWWRRRRETILWCGQSGWQRKSWPRSWSCWRYSRWRRRRWRSGQGSNIHVIRGKCVPFLCCFEARNKPFVVKEKFLHSLLLVLLDQQF